MDVKGKYITEQLAVVRMANTVSEFYEISIPKESDKNIYTLVCWLLAIWQKKLNEYPWNTYLREKVNEMKAILPIARNIANENKKS